VGLIMSRPGSGAQMYENFFESNVPPLPLPMIWRVVYNEAIRGNHILFDADDIKAIEDYYHSPSFKLSSDNSGAMARFAVKFFGSSDFGEMKSLFKSLTLEQKAVALILYRRSISVWKDWLKRNLH
jgi:hypothetical protein